MPDVSVSILVCTHNRAEVLAQALRSLADVRLPPGVPAELIVVANACTDRTAEVVEEARQRMPFPTRLVVEPRAGLSVARNRAVAESSHRILAFLDDDVWVDPEWLTELAAVYRDHGADMVGGRIELWWQAVERPAWFDDRWAANLSAVDLGTGTMELEHPQVFGANFSVSREVMDAVGPFRTDLGRKGTLLLAGEESQIVIDALAKGYRLFYAGRAPVKHWVAPHRATPEYLAAVTRGGAATIVLMREPFTARYAARTAAIAAARLALHTPAMLAALALGRTRARVRFGMGVAAGAGAMAGLWMRLRGRADGGAPTAPASAAPRPAAVTQGQRP